MEWVYPHFLNSSMALTYSPFSLDGLEGTLNYSQFLWFLIGTEFSNPVNKEAVDTT